MAQKQEGVRRRAVKCDNEGQARNRIVDLLQTLAECLWQMNKVDGARGE